MLFPNRMLQARRPLDAGLTSNTEEHVLSCVRKQRRLSGVDVELCISITSETTINMTYMWCLNVCVCLQSAD